MDVARPDFGQILIYFHIFTDRFPFKALLWECSLFMVGKLRGLVTFQSLESVTLLEAKMVVFVS